MSAAVDKAIAHLETIKDAGELLANTDILEKDVRYLLFLIGAKSLDRNFKVSMGSALAVAGPAAYVMTVATTAVANPLLAAGVVLGALAGTLGPAFGAGHIAEKRLEKRYADIVDKLNGQQKELQAMREDILQNRLNEVVRSPVAEKLLEQIPALKDIFAKAHMAEHRKTKIMLPKPHPRTPPPLP